MTLIKRVKDRSIKILLGKDSVPRGLFELRNYSRHYKSINFKVGKTDGGFVAVSTNFRYGSIITSGKSAGELDKNIKDAIMTAFEIPSVYAKEADIKRVGQVKKEYAFA